MQQKDRLSILTEEELDVLPRYAQMVIAARAIMRALPIASQASAHASRNNLEVIDSAVQLLMEVAETSGQMYFDRYAPFDSLGTALVKLDELINELSGGEESALSLICIAAAVEAVLLDENMRLTFHRSRSQSVASIVPISIYNATKVFEACPPEIVDAFRSAIRRDYNYLLSAEVTPLDHVAGAECSFSLGPLWPEGEPDYWPAGSHPLKITEATYRRISIEVKFKLPRHRPERNNLLVNTDWLFRFLGFDDDKGSLEQTEAASSTLDIYVVPQETQDLWLKEITFPVKPDESSLPLHKYVLAARDRASFDAPIKALTFSSDATIADVVKEVVGETPTCIARDELEDCIVKHFEEDYDPKFLDIYLSTPNMSLSRGGIQTTGREVFALNCKLKDAKVKDGDVLVLRRLSVRDVANQLQSDDLVARIGHHHGMVEHLRGYREFRELVYKIEDIDKPTYLPKLPSCPRLVLLYTNEDPQVAAYVRTHLHELDKQSGEYCNLVIIERPLDRSTYKYWRELLHERLYVVWKLLGWANSRPYDKGEAYLLASRLGIPFDKLPCAVEVDSNALKPLRIFPITGNLTSCFRRIFSEYQPRSSPEGQNLPLIRPIGTIMLDETQTAPVNTSRPASCPLCFLSYSSKDANVVHEVATILISYGINVWLDKWQIHPGDSVVAGIESGLLEADIMLVFLSPDSRESRWVEKEVSAAIVRAMDTGSPIIVPVVLSECFVPPLLSDCKRLEVGANPIRIANEIRRIIDQNHLTKYS